MNRLVASTLILVLAIAGSASAAPDAAPAAAAKPAPAAQPGATQPAGTIGFQALPTVQIFSGQLAVNLPLGASSPRPVTLSGAVYGLERFNGSITIFPNGPTSSACPVYVSGNNTNLSLAPNANFAVTVYLQAMPGMPARSTGTCTLAYTAFDQTASGMFNVSSGNQVNVPYTIRPPK